MKKRKKKTDSSTKLFIYAWGVTFLTASFFAVYINRLNGNSKWLLIAGAIIIMIAVSGLPLSILLGGIKNKFFRYGSQGTFIKFVRKNESPLFYNCLIVSNVLLIIAIYVVGIILIKKNILI